MNLKFQSLVFIVVPLLFFYCSLQKDNNMDEFLENWLKSNLEYVQENSIPKYMEKYLKSRTMGFNEQNSTYRKDFYKYYYKKITSCLESKDCRIQILELHHEGFVVHDKIFFATQKKDKFTLYEFDSAKAKERKVWEEGKIKKIINDQVCNTCEEEVRFDFVIITDFMSEDINTHIYLNCCMTPVNFFSVN